MGFVGEHAVVLGASMAGLLSARVLAEHYRAVTVVERDVLPDRPENRRGVPQGRHVHSLLPRGSQILDELFPGIIGELIADGAPVIDGDFAKIYLAPSGHLLARTGIAAQPTPTVIASRPLLEWHVARRLRDTANVTVRDGHEIAELTASGDRKRVTGVRAIDLPTGGELTLPADLVVDAMGRGAHTPALLERLGYDRPAEKHIRVHATYTSQLLRIPGEIAPERLIAIGPEPGRPRGLGLFGYENDHWMFTTFGVAGDSAAGSAVAMREFVAPFAPAHMLTALDAAEPVTDAVRHRFPSSQWRRYDKMRHFPDGLLPTGDAVASFTPSTHKA